MTNVKCDDCKQLVNREDAHLVKASNPSGRAWRCESCGDVAEARVDAVNAEIQDRSRRAIVAMFSGEGSYEECRRLLLRQERPELFPEEVGR